MNCRLQSRRRETVEFTFGARRQIILLSAVLIWLLFLASFLMPVVQSPSMVGWEAFWYTVRDLWDLPDYWQRVRREPILILFSTFPSTNGVMFIAPIILFRWPRWAGWLGVAPTFGGLVPLYIYFDSMRGLLVGFYCWVTSIFLMGITCFLCVRDAKAQSLRRAQQDSPPLQSRTES